VEKQCPEADHQVQGAVTVAQTAAAAAAVAVVAVAAGAAAGNKA
jgi:hypothetical protein